MPLKVSLASLLLLAGSASAQELWNVPLGAPVTSAPLVAEVAPAPGPEIFVALESGGIRAFQSDGKALWSAEAGAALPASSQAALLTGNDDQPALIAVAHAAGAVAFQADTGAEAWKTTAEQGPGTYWSIAADVNDDTQPDLIAASASGAVAAFGGRDGALLWESPAENVTTLSGAPAVADVDDNRAPEIYLAGKEGLRALDSEGRELWFAPLDGGAACAPIVADVDDNDDFEIYALAPDGTLLARDARNGDALWELKLEGMTGSAVQLATADLDQDETGEILIAGVLVQVVSAEGKLLFSENASASGIAIGDANADGELEVVAGSAAGLRLLNPALLPLASLPLPGPPVGGPVLANINGASVAWAGADNTLRVAKTGARLMPQLAPWAAPRRDAAGRAAALSPVKELDLLADAPKLANGSGALGIATGFETPEQANAWQVITGGGNTARDEAVKSNGASSLAAKPAAEEQRVASPVAVLTPDLRRLSASVLAKGEGAKAFLAWERATGEPFLQELRPADTTPEGWRRMRLSNIAKPAGAVRVRMLLLSPPSTETWWDDVQLSAQTASVPFVELFYNQAGYEVAMPKRFTAASTFSTPQGAFRILNEKGTVVHEGKTEPPSRITGANGADWGRLFWRGDFTPLDEPGKYRIELDIDGNLVQSGEFEIAPDLLWTHLYAPLSSAVHDRRCGEGIPCDSASAAWDQRGATSTDASVLRALNEIYSIILWRIFDRESGALPGLGQELQWGGDRLIDQLKAGEPSDDLVVALAGLARNFPGEQRFVDAARAALSAPRAMPLPPLQEYCAAIDLYVATRDAALLPRVQALYPGPATEIPEYVVRYEAEIDEAVMVTFDLGKRLAEQADALLKRADNPFGICPDARDGLPRYFDDSEARMGNTAQLLRAAALVARAYRYTPKIEYQRFIFDQFNWLLGNNPFGISFVEGVGTRNLPAYAKPNTKFPRGVPTGAVANGAAASAEGADVPSLTAVSADCPLANSVAMLDALAHFKRIRTSGAQKAQP